MSSLLTEYENKEREELFVSEEKQPDFTDPGKNRDKKGAEPEKGKKTEVKKEKRQ